MSGTASVVVLKTQNFGESRRQWLERIGAFHMRVKRLQEQASMQ
jgi:hypothetical protein